MCEANVYFVDREGRERLVLESVDKVVPSEEGVFLENIYRERKTIRAKIKAMELVDHKIILEELSKL